MRALRRLWASRSPLERTIVTILTAVLGIAAYAGFVQWAERSRTQLQPKVAALRIQAAGLDQQAAELARLRSAPAVSFSQTDLRTLVQEQAGEAGVSGALVRIDAPDADHVVVAFGAVPFADWLDWLARLKSQHVSLASCRIEALSTPGMVGVTATLARARPQ